MTKRRISGNGRNVRIAGAVLGLVAVLATSASCLDPTEITLDVSTDVRCSDTKGTMFIGGASGSTEGAAPNTTTTTCDNGAIGTLVATPSSSKDAAASFVIVMGVDRPVAECSRANHYKGCIVQRRAIQYAKHKPINLPIRMWLVCKDVECDADSTCARNGKCVPAKISDPESCSGACYPEGDTPDVPPVEAGADGTGGTDSSKDSPTDGPMEGGLTDGPPVGDADADADGNIIIGPPPLTLYCPPVPGGFCARTDTCCWSRSGTMGHCNNCIANDIPLRCNAITDCMPGERCCAAIISVDMGMGPVRTVTGSGCMAAAVSPCPGAYLCRGDVDCPITAPTCNLNVTDFNPPGIFGECQ